MRSGAIVKICRRFIRRENRRHWRQRFRVNYEIAGIVYMTGLEDEMPEYAMPNELILLRPGQ